MNIIINFQCTKYRQFCHQWNCLSSLHHLFNFLSHDFATGIFRCL